MIYYKLSRFVQRLGTIIAASGAFGAGFTKAIGGTISSESIWIGIVGMAVFIAGLIMEGILDKLNEERENKRAIKRHLKRIDENENEK